MPEISVVVPVYNLEKLIIRCLESIEAQTFTDWECIVVDDGSADSSLQICRSFAEKHSRFSVYSQANGGVSAARNTGIGKVRGRYIVFVDGDDTIQPDLLEWAMARQAEHPDDQIAWNLNHPGDEPEQEGDRTCPKAYTAPQAQAYLCSGIGSNVTSKLFHAQVIRQNSLRFPVGITRGEDGVFSQAYIFAFFEMFPDAHLYQYNHRFYIIGQEAENRASDIIVKKHEIDWDPEQARGYGAKIMAEYAGLIDAMGGWQSFSDEEAIHFAIQYARRFAFAVWAADQLGETLPAGFWGEKAVGSLVKGMKQRRVYNAYYWPLRLKRKGLVAKVYYSDETEDKRFYWRVFLIGDLLLLRRWKRL